MPSSTANVNAGKISLNLREKHSSVNSSISKADDLFHSQNENQGSKLDAIDVAFNYHTSTAQSNKKLAGLECITQSYNLLISDSSSQMQR